MRFTPLTDQELNKLFEPGIYEYEVIKAEEKISKKGNPMLHIVIRVFDTIGRSQLINDYLITGIESARWKIYDFCHSCGLGEIYQAGEISSEMCRGKSGKVKIKIDKDTSGQYPDKNVVADYITKIDTVDAPKDLNDDIPF